MTQPPDTLIIGMLDDGRGLEAFTTDEEAVAWIERHRNSPARRQVRLWHVQISHPLSLVVVPPVPARLIVEGDIVDEAP